MRPSTGLKEPSVSLCVGMHVAISTGVNFCHFMFANLKTTVINY